MYGIPNMKLDKQVILRRVKLMEEEGVTFKCGVEVGHDITIQEIKATYNAVVLCTGSTKPRNLQAPGRELNGIHFAVDYLRTNTEALFAANHFDKEGSAPGLAIDAKGKKCSNYRRRRYRY